MSHGIDFPSFAVVYLKNKLVVGACQVHVQHHVLDLLLLLA